jgi:hypothetical protein
VDVAARRRVKRVEQPYAARKTMTAERRHEATAAATSRRWVEYEHSLLSWARAGSPLAVLLTCRGLARTASRILVLGARRPDSVRCMGVPGAASPGDCYARSYDRAAARF